MTLKSEIPKSDSEIINNISSYSDTKTPQNEDRLCFDDFSLKTLHSNYEYLSKCNNSFPHHKTLPENTEHEQSSEFYGFPMSDFVQKIPVQPLKYKSFETACHFLGDYADKLLGKNQLH